MRNRREQGMALITALLVLLLISSMIVGMSFLVLTDQKLGGNNADRQKAFYGAEAGMESLTTALQDGFSNNYALSAADITNIVANTQTTTTNLPGMQFLNPDGTNGFMINFTADTSANNLGNPTAVSHTILSGTYAGLIGLLTPYTLQVTSRTPMGSEVRLQRTVQTVAIPVFQFGIFSDTDLSYFAGPNFDFGGRVHTNGNLWLAEGDNATLTMRDKVTAVGEVVRTNLENGWPLTTAYNGTISITENPGSGPFANLGQNQGSTTGTSWFGNIAGTQETAFQTVSNTYNGNLGNGATGVKALDLTIATPAIGGTAIDMLRLPQPGELVANPGKLKERYYSQASLRIMLSDYDANGTCANSDLVGLDYASPNTPNTPVDLASLAWDTTAPNPAAGLAPVGQVPKAAWLANQGVTVFPLPVSDAQGGAAGYKTADGYWVQKWFPIETGCIKIDYQTKAGLVWVDVTQQILNLGFTGRNLNQQTKAVMSIAANQVPNRLALPPAQIAPSGCGDPSPSAVIRLARVRDNPASANGAGGCGFPYVARGTDYVPNVLYDTREGILRDDPLPVVAITSPTGQATLAGAMHYVELDVNNLDNWFKGAGAVANNTTGYTVYFSDRRGDRKDPNPPASVGVGPRKTGAFGYDDIVNPNDANSCPDNVLQGAEDFESDFVHGTDLNPPAGPKNYDQFFPTDNNVAPNNPMLWTVNNTAMQVPNLFTSPAVPGTTVIQNHPKCAGPAPKGNAWPYAAALNVGDLRLNPPVYFRRALKVVNGGTISLGVCDGVACGLSIVSENPVYVQGDYNAGANGNFATPFVAAAVMGDAVTFLSNNWNDVNSFAFPYGSLNAAGAASITNGGRNATTTTYRMAIVGGKTIPFKQPPAGTGGAANGKSDFGTDGGVHNFLRYLENWGGQTLWYKGSIVALFYSHQAAGTFKCCNTVYSPPTRGYSFQTEFLTPSLLPPRTPMFRDINTLGFTQLILSTEGVD